MSEKKRVIVVMLQTGYQPRQPPSGAKESLTGEEEKDLVQD